MRSVAEYLTLQLRLCRGASCTSPKKRKLDVTQALTIEHIRHLGNTHTFVSTILDWDTISKGHWLPTQPL